MRQPNSRVITGALLAAAAAMPSLLWALADPAYFMDDLGHALAFEREGAIGGALDRSFESTGRPLVGFYYLFTYGLLGSPTANVLFLGVLNAVLVVALWLVARLFMPAHIALLAAALFAVAPNRASTRLWAASGQYVAASLIVVAAFALLAIRGRPLAAGVVAAAGILLFEGSIGLHLGLVLCWMAAEPHIRLRPALYALSPGLVAGAIMYVLSPKRETRAGTPTSLDSIGTVGHGLLGRGLWGSDVVGLTAVGVLAVAVAYSLATLLPSFRQTSAWLRWFRVGTVLSVLACIPFVVNGSPFGIRGIFDRTNLVPLVGVCLMFAALLSRLRRVSEPLFIGTAVIALLLPAWNNVYDIDDYDRAARSGEKIARRALADLEPDLETIVVPPDEGAQGVAMMYAAYDLSQVLELETGRSYPRISMPPTNRECLRLAEGRGDMTFYDWRTRRFERADENGCDTAT